MGDWDSLLNQPVRVARMGFTISVLVDEDGNVVVPAQTCPSHYLGEREMSAEEYRAVNWVELKEGTEIHGTIPS